MKQIEIALSKVVAGIGTNYVQPTDEKVDDIFNPGMKIKNPFFGITKRAVKFEFGTQKELNVWIKDTSDKYPVIWLVYPIKEKSDNKSSVYSYERMRFIFAVNTTSDKLVKARLQTTRFVLDQLTEKFTQLLQRSTMTKFIWMDKNVNKSEEFHPNYSVNTAQTENGVVDVWDAIALECDIHLVPNCIPKN